jgi:hypothetical protein
VTLNAKLRQTAARCLLAVAASVTLTLAASAVPASAEGYCVDVYSGGTIVTVCTPWD